MQYPGVSPFGGFGGTSALTNALKPQSLEHRKQQLIHQMVTGGDNSNLTIGAGQGDSPGRAPSLGFNPFMTSYLNSLSASQDPQSPFYGGNGEPTPSPQGNPQVSGQPAPRQLLGGPPPEQGISSGAGPMATGAGNPVQGIVQALAGLNAPSFAPRRLISDYTPSRGGIVGAHNPYYGLDPDGIQRIGGILANQMGPLPGRVF